MPVPVRKSLLKNIGCLFHGASAIIPTSIVPRFTYSYDKNNKNGTSQPKKVLILEVRSIDYKHSFRFGYGTDCYKQVVRA